MELDRADRLDEAARPVSEWEQLTFGDAFGLPPAIPVRRDARHHQTHKNNTHKNNKGLQAMRAGYKQTAVGWIPADWELVRLGEVSDIDTDNLGSDTRPDYVFNYIALDDVSAGVLCGHATQVFRAAPSRARRKLRKGDVLVATVRPNLKSHLLFNEDGADWVCSTGFSVVRSRPGITHPGYLYYHLFDGCIPRQIERLLSGSNYPAINGGDVRALLLPLPPYAEQCAIAEMLSDMDDAVRQMDQLLVKKRDRKLAVMQHLLTGRTRLPAFDGEWRSRQLGELGVFKSGDAFPVQQQGQTEGEYPFYKVSDMNSAGNGVQMTCANHWVSSVVRKQIGATVFPKNTIIFAKIGAAIFLERKRILAQDSCIDNNMMGFILNESQADARFVHYRLQLVQLGKLVAVTALPSLSAKAVGDIGITIPGRDEQAAIAGVIADMEAEIDALEARRDKALALKLATGQHLLTGWARLA